MCGIAGFSLHPEDVQTTDTFGLARALLVGIEHRGRHATGIGYTDPATGDVWTQKADIKATEFVRSMTHDIANARTAILHTRYATKGDPADEGNNHPIVRPGIVGTHNGVLRNDEQLWADHGWTRHAEVDSEVIFAAIDSSGLDAHEALGMIRGDAAVAWIELDRPHTLKVGRLSGRPLIIGQTEAGSLVYCSEADPLLAAAEKAGLQITDLFPCPQFALLTVRAGRINERQFIPTRIGSAR